MATRISAASIVTLMFTTAVGKSTDSLTANARQQLAQTVQSLKALMGSKFPENVKAALARADQGTETDKDMVTNYLGVAMDQDEAFAQQVRSLAQEIQQVLSAGQVRGQTVQNVQNVFGGEAKQLNNPTGPVIMGGHNNTIHIGNA